MIEPKPAAGVEWHTKTRCTAFKGSKRIAAGELSVVALKVKMALDRNDVREAVFIFDDATSEMIEVDFRGSADDVLGRIAPAPADTEAPDSADASSEAVRGRGRPRLGVVAREVTLLPRHWQWLNSQPGGASVALRKLVEMARRDNQGTDRKRKAREAGYRFMSVMAGNRRGFEEAARALFAGDRKAFEKRVQPWPAAIGTHLKKLADPAF